MTVEIETLFVKTVQMRKFSASKGRGNYAEYRFDIGERLPCHLRFSGHPQIENGTTINFVRRFSRSVDVDCFSLSPAHEVTVARNGWDLLRDSSFFLVAIAIAYVAMNSLDFLPRWVLGLFSLMLVTYLLGEVVIDCRAIRGGLALQRFVRIC